MNPDKPSTDAPFDPAAVPIRAAATVMLVRDHPINGLEVFMLQRTLAAVFAKGMYVFPGGRVDANDNEEKLEAICDGLDDEEASALLGIPNGGLSYWVAAIRECFEEAGVLLARPTNSNELVRFDTDSVLQNRFNVARHAIHDSNMSLIELCTTENLRLVTNNIHYVSHWITPLGEPRRFDTRFFIARAPEAQEPLQDNSETIASLWVSPIEALERHACGDLAMIPPTTSNLQFLAPHDTTTDALNAAKKIGTPTAILPKLKTDGEGKVIGIAMPGDADYN
jgi:8-oxo-dGTP pyrophosphatase MutT (NUDIX family)